MGFWDIWDSIKNKVVNAGSAVVGAAKSVRKGVDLSYTTAGGLIRLSIVTKTHEFYQN